MRGPHDVGGLDFGPIDTTPHDMTFWEKQIDAMHTLLADDKRRIKVPDVNRFYIESLGQEIYHSLSYFELWTSALCRQLLEKGILTQDEINAKIDELKARDDQGKP